MQIVNVPMSQNLDMDRLFK
ncbi:hypothetical protein AVEN_247875-1, partial [Araneus ventricosus]